MQTSEHGIKFIMSNEGVVLHPYRDSVGYMTIGVGHKIELGEDFPGLITEEDAMSLLKLDLKRFEDAVNESVEVSLTQNQFDALIDFAFNVGTGAFQRSTLLELLNQGKYDEIPAQFGRWTKQPELIGRRRREAQLWLS
jgi:lysozyme